MLVCDDAEVPDALATEAEPGGSTDPGKAGEGGMPESGERGAWGSQMYGFPESMYKDRRAAIKTRSQGEKERRRRGSQAAGNKPFHARRTSKFERAAETGKGRRLHKP